MMTMTTLITADDVDVQLEICMFDKKLETVAEQKKHKQKREKKENKRASSR